MRRTVRGVRFALVAAAVAALCAVAAPAARQRMGTFRAGVDLVTVDVSVRQDNMPVTGLTSADFVVTDNGVRQGVDVVDLASLPIDVSILLDTSGSMAPVMEDVIAQARAAASLLGPEDQLRVLTFAWDVGTGRFVSGGGSVEIGPIEAKGATALKDGLAIALMHPRAGDRRHLVVAYTDGADNASSLGIEDLAMISERTDSVLRVIVVKLMPMVGFRVQTDVELLDTRRRWYAPRAREGYYTLGEIARNTGGDVEELVVRGDSHASLARTIREFRESYVIGYRITGVGLPGRHEIGIKVARPGRFDIKARKHYVIEQ